MEIEKLLNELEDMIEVSWHLPMSGGKSLLDAKEKYEDLARKIETNISISPDNLLIRCSNVIGKPGGNMVVNHAIVVSKVTSELIFAGIHPTVVIPYRINKRLSTRL